MPTTPTNEIPDIKVLSAIFVAIGTLIVAVVGWLDKRAKSQRDDTLAEHAKDIELLKDEILKLTERVNSLENGQREARKILVEALVIDDVNKIREQIRRSIDVLH
jgi:hypothetical protein